MTALLPARFDIWVAALASGFLPLARFVAWADSRIVADPHQPRWVLDLALARRAEDAEKVLGLEWSRRSEDPTSGVPPLGRGAALHVGFLFLAYEQGRVSLEELLRRAGERADASGDPAVPACEAFYLLLNEVDGRGPVRRSTRPLPDRVRELFAPMASEARRALAYLPEPTAAG